MNAISMFVPLIVLLSSGPASAKVDEVDLGYSGSTPAVAPQETNIVLETKDPFYAPEPDPKPERSTCATPRDGQNSKDEGERVMCDHSAPPPSESSPK